MADQILKFDFDALTVAEIDYLEDELNHRLRDILGDKIVSFNDIVENFRPHKEGEPGPLVKIPQGKILRVMAMIQLRKSDPDVTWEQAGELRLNMEVAPPKAETMVASAVEAAKVPETELQELLTKPRDYAMMPPSLPNDTDG